MRDLDQHSSYPVLVAFIPHLREGDEALEGAVHLHIVRHIGTAFFEASIDTVVLSESQGKSSARSSLS